MFKNRIEWALNDHIEDLFTALQNDLGIKYGDVSPLDSLELENAQNALADVVARILTEQAKMCGARVFYNVENDTIVTIGELYKMFKAENAGDDFEHYIEQCLTDNNGSLMEIE